MQIIDSKKEFSLMQRARSFVHASRGVCVFLKTTPNVWIHLAVFVGAIVLGSYLKITTTEWAIIFLTTGLVLTAEAFNTAIEIDINLTSPEYHPYARDTKDVSAGAVLIASTAAVFVGLFIFLPYIV